MNTKPFSIFLFFILLLSSCKKDDNSSPDSAKLSNSIQNGTWRITLYNDSGTDELYHFAGYNFTFSNGSVSAVKNGTTVTGTYHSHTDSNKKKFVLNFGSTVPFEELNDDWEVIENTDSKIRLQDISGGGSGTDLLTFEKN
jgi:hypothetical protein